MATIVGVVACGSDTNEGAADSGQEGSTAASADGGGSLEGDGNGSTSGPSATDAGLLADTGLQTLSCPTAAVDGGAATIAVAAGPGTAPGGSTPVALDGAGTGRTFDGIGAISGGGGNSRLLFDYPEPYRSQVLDYLFKPGVGAALQILKVEIGGDMNSTDGAEASHMHTATDLACNRGYEWWLMEQAKARNPAIKLYGLAWGAPGWIGGGNFWSQDMVNYLMKWLGCAKTNGLSIDYLGGWNERGYNKGWYENLHSTLAAGGYGVKVVGADDGWNVGADMASDATFEKAVDIIGVHYPCGGDGAPATSCPADATSLGLGVPLWASENGSQDLNTGAPAMIRAIVRGYVDGKMTAYINWPLVAAIGPGLAWPTMGLIQANRPWSGWYSIGKQTWVSAHVTQFTKPGWSFIDKSSGYVGGNKTNGSYVTLKAPTGGDYSVILETTTANQPQTVSFTVGGGLSKGAVHVWATDLASSDPADMFTHAADITPAADGTFWITLPPNAVITVSTTSGQGKGSAQPPLPSAALLPYTQSFEGYAIGTLAPYIGDQSGAFDVEACGGGKGGQCLRQMTPVAPIGWSSDGQAYNLLGSNDWADYNVSVDAMLEHPGSVEILGRFGGATTWNISHVDAYMFSVRDTGAWSIVKSDQAGTLTSIASGTGAALGTGTWHHLEFGMQGSALTASVDRQTVGHTTDGAYAAGPAGLGVGMISGGWFNAQFDNLSITPLGPLSTSYTYTFVNRASGLALGVAAQSTANGALLEQSTSDGDPAQNWQIAGDRSGSVVLLNFHSGLAIDVPPASVDGGSVDQQTPDSGTAERWTLAPAGNSYFRVLTSNGMALSSTPGGSTIALAPLDCASNAQQWSLAAALSQVTPYTIINRATGWLVDVNDQSTASGAAIIQWAATGGLNQEWLLKATAGGLSLVNKNSGMALGVAGTVVDQATPNGGPGQVWTLQLTRDGYYSIVSGTSKDVLESPSSTQGDQLAVGTPSGSAAQEWTLAPAP